jgi:hypothetical protein
MKYEIQRSVCTTQGRFSHAGLRLKELNNVLVIVRDPFYQMWLKLKHAQHHNCEGVASNKGEDPWACLLEFDKLETFDKEDGYSSTSSRQKDQGVDLKTHANKGLRGLKEMNLTPEDQERLGLAMKEFYLKHRYFLFFDFATFHTMFASDVEATLQMQKEGSSAEQQIQHVIQYHHTGNDKPQRQSFSFVSYEAIAYSSFALFNEDVMPEHQRLWDSRTDINTDPSLPKLVNSSFFPTLIQDRSGLPFQRSRAGCAFSLVPEVDEELIMTEIPAMHAFYAEHPKILQKVRTLIEETWTQIGLQKEQRTFVLS